jgi:AbrB family looped-hinge helix DNA binding protein
METVRLSSKNQVVVPKEARQILGVGAGDELLFVSRNGMVYLLPRSGSLVESLRGRAKGRLRYPRNYLKRERDSW